VGGDPVLRLHLFDIQRGDPQVAVVRERTWMTPQPRIGQKSASRSTAGNVPDRRPAT
jgi:hypothetical protein